MITFGTSTGGSTISIPGPTGLYDFIEDTFTPAAAQIGTLTPVFVLTQIPVDLEAMHCYINGKAETNIVGSIGSKNVTINLPGYTLDGSDSVHFEYPYQTF